MRLATTAACLGAALLLNAAAAAAVVSRLEVQGSAGDGLTGGAPVVLDGGAGRFTTLVSTAIAVDLATFELRSVPYGLSVFYVADLMPGCLPLGCVARLDLFAAGSGPLGLGTYSGTRRTGGSSPGLDLTLGSAGFASATGSFTITDLAFAPGSPLLLPALDRLAASFTLQGDGNAGAVSGRILINQPVPVAEPGSLTLVLVGLAGMAGWRRSSASRKDWTGAGAGGSVPSRGSQPRQTLNRRPDEEETP